MFRNAIIALVIGPPVYAAVILAIPAAAMVVTLPFHMSVSGLIAAPFMLLYAAFFAYWVGWAPALIGGALNGLAQLVVRTPRARRWVAGSLGVAVTVGMIVLYMKTPPKEMLSGWPTLLMFSAAGAVAAIASNAVAEKLRRSMEAAA